MMERKWHSMLKGGFNTLNIDNRQLEFMMVCYASCWSKK